MSYTTFNEALSTVITVDDIKKLSPLAIKLLYENFAEWETMELPEGDPPRKELAGQPDTAYEKLVSQKTMRMIPHWKNKNIKQSKREHLFIEFLESLHSDEARLLVAIKDKKLSEMFPNVTRELVDAAFPSLLVLPTGRTL